MGNADLLADTGARLAEMRDAASQLAARQPSGVLKGYLRGQVRGLEIALDVLRGDGDSRAHELEIEEMRNAAAKMAARQAAGRQRANLRGRAQGLSIALDVLWTAADEQEESEKPSVLDPKFVAK